MFYSERFRCVMGSGLVLVMVEVKIFIFDNFENVMVLECFGVCLMFDFEDVER